MARSTGSGRAASASGSGSTQTSSNGTALPNTPARRKGRTEQMSERQMQKVSGWLAAQRENIRDRELLERQQMDTRTISSQSILMQFTLFLEIILLDRCQRLVFQHLCYTTISSRQLSQTCLNSFLPILSLLQVHSRLLMSERKVKQFSHNQTDSHDSLAGIAEVDPNNLLDPNGLIPTSTNGGDGLEDHRQGSTRETTEYFLKRNGADRNHGSGALNKSMNLGAGKGPDGVALAKAAARGGFKGQGESNDVSMSS